MEDLKGYLLEEAYEVIDAITMGDPTSLREELGDLLFQVVFLSRIASEKGDFTVDEVLHTITQKMIRRHPHVFGDSSAKTSGEVLKQWEQIKRAEKAGDRASSALDGVPKSLPALLRAQRLTTKAARVGFDWPGIPQVLSKVEEELTELREAMGEGTPEAAEELGDLLFAIANLARHLRLDPETALQQANQKFDGRFRRVEGFLREAGRDPSRATLAEMDRLWDRVKSEDEEQRHGPEKT
jgi:MazG family protein